MFTGVFGSSMMWKAQNGELVELSTIDLRQFGLGPRKQVDDKARADVRGCGACEVNRPVRKGSIDDTTRGALEAGFSAVLCR